MTAALHPRLAELRAELDRARSGLLAVVEGMSAEASGQRANPDGWSVAETVEHLMIVEQGIGRLLGKLAKQADALGPETATTSVSASIDRLKLTDATRRIRSPAAVAPTGNVSLAEALTGLHEGRKRLLDLLQRVNGRAVGVLAAPHPLFGELTFYQWLLFLARHEERHTRQIVETMRRLSEQARAAGH